MSGKGAVVFSVSVVVTHLSYSFISHQVYWGKITVFRKVHQIVLQRIEESRMNFCILAHFLDTASMEWLLEFLGEALLTSMGGMLKEVIADAAKHNPHDKKFVQFVSWYTIFSAQNLSTMRLTHLVEKNSERHGCNSAI